MATDSTSGEVRSKRGDVILHVGKAPQTERKLLVSSVLLSHVSPVFAAMFDGHFAEGQAMTSESPRAVLPPEDDADAMAAVCKIAHSCTANVATDTTPTRFADIALICHKYDCVEVVRACSLLSITKVMQDPLAIDFEKMLEATYLLGMGARVSRSLHKSHSGLLRVTDYLRDVQRS